MSSLASFVQGLVLGLALFVAPGPKDVLILRETLAGQSPFKLIAIAVGSDVILIVCGMLGLSALLREAPELRSTALWLGVGLLILHGLQAARNAITGLHAESAARALDASSGKARGLGAVILVSLGNPVAWLDTVLVIGTMAASLAAPMNISFCAGAVVASLAWFMAWVLGARNLRRFMTASLAWRILDALIACAMIAMAAVIAHGLSGAQDDAPGDGAGAKVGERGIGL